MSEKRLTSKELKAQAFNEMIAEKLRDGIIREKLTTPFFDCKKCVMDKECMSHISLSCMAHNRESRDSIYYLPRKK